MFGSTPGLLDLLGDDGHTLFDTLLIADGNLADGANTLLDKLRVNLTHVLLELLQDQLVVLVVDDPG
jgi:hypothetical protein